MEILVWSALALLVGLWATNRGRSCLWWTVLSFLISPLLAAILLLVLGYSRRCPFCGGGIPKEATVCKHCGRSLTADKK